MIAGASSVAAMVIAAVLLVRAWRGNCLGQYFLFYSYLFFGLLCAVALWFVVTFFPALYRVVYWPVVMVGLLVEFAVLLDISNHLFRPYPIIRGLARLATGGLCVSLFMLYVFPPIMEGGGYADAFMMLGMRVAVSQVLILLLFLALARYYGIVLNHNLRGLCAGFAILEAGRIVTIGLAVQMAPAYSSIPMEMVPIFGLICMVVWLYGLWNIDPVSNMVTSEGEAQSILEGRLSRLREVVMRFRP